MNETRHASAEFCDYCGLPVQARRTSSSSDAVFCCLGCKLAAAIMRERVQQVTGPSTLTRLGLGLFFAMNVMVFTVALWSWDLYAMEDSRATLLRELYHHVALLFSLPVLLLLGGPLLSSAIEEACQGRVTTDGLLSIGVLASYAYSTIEVLTGGSHVYFEVGSTILVAVTLGRWLEANGKQLATRSLNSLQRLLPEQVAMLVDGRDQLVSVSDVPVGAAIRIMPGNRVPLDGELLSEWAVVDQQIVTGESEPCVKQMGQVIYGGSINGDLQAIVRVTAPASEGTVQRIIEAVQQAALVKNKYQRLADTVAAWFVPTVLVLAMLGMLAHAFYEGFHQGLMVALTVLLIACPCALAIATPLATWTALGEAAQRGVLFRNGDAILQLADVDCFIFDKTGTLTTGGLADDKPTYLDKNVTRRQAEEITLMLAKASHHPLAKEVARNCECTPDACIESIHAIEQIESVPGLGMRGRLIDGEPVALGSATFVAEAVGLNLEAWSQQHVELAKRLREETNCVAGWDRDIQMVYFFAEELRPHAAESLHRLRQNGLSVCVLTGDRRQRAIQLAKTLCVEVQGELLPQDKLEFVAARQAAGHRVAFVGDGINDAPALAAADVGIALGCGADVTREAGTVCLAGDDLGTLPRVYGLAKATQSVIRRNLVWAFAYNFCGIGLALTGKLNPMLAAAAMLLSGLFVITNSLRLKTVASRLWSCVRSVEVGPNDPLRHASNQVDSAPVFVVGESG